MARSSREFAITHADVLREITPRTFKRRLTGVTILRVWRRAKLIVIDLSSGTAS